MTADWARAHVLPNHQKFSFKAIWTIRVFTAIEVIKPNV
jgi:hypothetical protein